MQRRTRQVGASGPPAVGRCAAGHRPRLRRARARGGGPRSSDVIHGGGRDRAPAAHGGNAPALRDRSGRRPRAEALGAHGAASLPAAHRREGAAVLVHDRRAPVLDAIRRAPSRSPRRTAGEATSETQHAIKTSKMSLLRSSLRTWWPTTRGAAFTARNCDVLTAVSEGTVADAGRRYARDQRRFPTAAPAAALPVRRPVPSAPRGARG
jgi:hypothetical protein